MTGDDRSRKQVAVVGAGLIGQSWAIVFARAGWRVRLFDRCEGVRNALPIEIRSALADLVRFQLCDDPEVVFQRISVFDRLEDALEGAVLVQESLPEQVDIKREVFEILDRLAPADAILASSTSAIVASRFTEGLAGRHRCLVAHPVNPPHLVPLVELCPAPWTDKSVVEEARRIYEAVDQVAIIVRKEVDGFVLNRLQGALLTESLRLVAEGVATPQDIDKTVKDGLGLRWSFMGPFETIELNAPGGIKDYVERYGPFYAGLAAQAADASVWQAPSIGILLASWPEPSEAFLAARKDWRDSRLAAVVAYRRRAEPPPKR